MLKSLMHNGDDSQDPFSGFVNIDDQKSKFMKRNTCPQPDNSGYSNQRKRSTTIVIFSC